MSAKEFVHLAAKTSTDPVSVSDVFWGRFPACRASGIRELPLSRNRDRVTCPTCKRLMKGGPRA